MNDIGISARGMPKGEAGVRLIEVRTLGAFSVTVDGSPLTFSRKTPKRPLSLLKAIVALGRPTVSEYRLTDALWPDSEADAAHQAFHMALHRLRKLLGQHAAVILQDGRVGLDAGGCWVDLWALEGLTGPGADGDPARILDQALALYRGDFLADDDGPWTIAPRERLRERFVHLVTGQAGRLEAVGRWHESLHFFHQAIEVDHRAEVFYQGAMRAALHLERRAEGITLFRRLQGMLPALCGAAPSAETEQLLRLLLG
jgi:LuxR family maltose regulon positive regulatory protein